MERPDGTPWEIVQFSNSFENNVFVTGSSGSVLASKMYYGDHIKTVFLYKFLPDDWTEEFNNHLHKVMDKTATQDFFIPENESELVAFVEKLKEMKG